MNIAKNLEELKKIKEKGLTKAQEATQIRHKLTAYASGKWDVTQDILIDIYVAGCLNISTGSQDTQYSCPKLLELSEAEVDRRFGNEPELAEIIKGAMPGVKTLQRWVKRQDWKDEVEKRMKDDNLFSLDRRAAMVNMVFMRGLKEQDIKAAEMYLKMSGDLTNKPKEKDKGYEAYQELAASLIKNKTQK
tara:strand:+ start:4017 stop:4586 length:570 start_codon:yes stop_codon:yes gene_type:complete